MKDLVDIFKDIEQDMCAAIRLGPHWEPDWDKGGPGYHQAGEMVDQVNLCDGDEIEWGV